MFRVTTALRMFFSLVLVCFTIAFISRLNQIVNEKESKIDSLPDQHDEDADQLISESDLKVPGSDTFCPRYRPASDFAERITFIETSGHKCLSPRSVCGIESAARINPEMQIDVHIDTRKLIEKDTFIKPGQYRNCRVTSLLRKFPNVNITREDLSLHLNDSKWKTFTTTLLKIEDDITEDHLIEAVKFVLLYRQGGIYLDSDMITFRPLHCLRNSVPFMSRTRLLNTQVLSFDAQHPFLSFAIRSIFLNYGTANRFVPSSLGLTEAFKVFCSKGNFTLKSGEYVCHKEARMELMDETAFFPLPRSNTHQYYETQFSPTWLAPFKQSYLAQTSGNDWGSLVPDSSLYAALARRYCPSTWMLSQSSPHGF